MAEEKKGQSIEKWDEVKGSQAPEEVIPEPANVPEDIKGDRDFGEQMRNTEDMLEQNDSCIDGIINNLPEPEEPHDKKSVIKKLKDCAKSVEEESERLPKMHCPVLERE